MDDDRRHDFDEDAQSVPDSREGVAVGTAGAGPVDLLHLLTPTADTKTEVAIFGQCVGGRIAAAPTDPGSWFAPQADPTGPLAPALVHEAALTPERLKLLESVSALPQTYIDLHSGKPKVNIDHLKLMIVYLRNSTRDQETSLENQLRALQAKADLEGILIVGAIEQDEAETGTRLVNRPGLRSALARIAAHEGNILGVHTTSRASREPADLIEIWTTVTEARARIFSCDKGYVGEFEIFMEAAFQLP